MQFKHETSTYEKLWNLTVLSNSMSRINLSYIIPAYNEERHLPILIQSIKLHTPNQYEYEIIVADHTSKDDTANLARELGAQVVTASGGTIAGLRNLAASKATGSVYIFLDADIELTRDWQDHFPQTYELLIKRPATLTGSLCGIPDDPSFIERYWFGPMQAKDIRYINSGHLITTRILFDQIGGFDARLQTGEDFDFSARARNSGAEIQPNAKLRVIHHGYPTTLAAFTRREIWHGRGDCQSLKDILSSTVMLVSIVFSSLHVVTIVSVVFAKNYIVASFGLCTIAALCLGSSIVKFKKQTLIGVATTSWLYYFYFMARSISCIRTLVAPEPSKRQR